jgi:Site-specific recombinases, DNA invertase Pin homologs
MKGQPNKNKKIYLYARLSQEDEQAGDSNSIINQRSILTKYAEENNLTPYEFVYDDGYSGTDWERPAFSQIIEDVEAGNVSTVVVKDLSRFGRDYLKVGFYSEILFPNHDVRLIAVHDNVDTDLGENDLAPMVNLFNEWFVKSTSRKVRAIINAKGKSGARIAGVPLYGYRNSEENPGKLEIDEESAAVVRRIFNMYANGVGARGIAMALTSEGISNPTTYKSENGILKKPRPAGTTTYWHASTIRIILDSQEYLGHTVNFKTYSKSYKDKKSRKNAPENQMVFENTHPAIVDKAIWDIVRKMRSHKRRPPVYGTPGMFSGLAYCADCNAKLYFNMRKITTKKYGEKLDGAYACSVYKKDLSAGYPRKCSAHYIREEVLKDIVSEEIRKVLAFVSKNEKAFALQIMETNEAEQKREITTHERIVIQKRKRFEELDKIFERIYEDNIVGKLSDERFVKMSAKYEQEQRDLKNEIVNLETLILTSESRLGNVDHFIKLVREYSEVETLSQGMVNAMIDRIIVHEPTVAYGSNRTQEVEIFFTGVGKVDMPQEQALEQTQSSAQQEQLQAHQYNPDDAVAS